MWWDVFKITTPGKPNFGFTTPGKILGEMFLRPLKSLRWDVKFKHAKENCAQKNFWSHFFIVLESKCDFVPLKKIFNCDPGNYFRKDVKNPT